MLSKKDAQSALEKCNGMKVAAGMAGNIVSEKQKTKKQCREEKRRQNVKSEDGEEETVEETEQTGRERGERVIAVDWALGKERWVKERERFEEVADDVEMDDAASDVSTHEDGEADGEHEPLGIHEEGSEDEGGKDYDSENSEPLERDSDDESSNRPRLPHTDTGNTLFIRNIPFTATEDELRSLYVSPFQFMQSLTHMIDSGPSAHFDTSALQSIQKLSVPGEPGSRASGTRRMRTKPSSKAKFCVQRPRELRRR